MKNSSNNKSFCKLCGREVEFPGAGCYMCGEGLVEETVEHLGNGLVRETMENGAVYEYYTCKWCDMPINGPKCFCRHCGNYQDEY